MANRIALPKGSNCLTCKWLCKLSRRLHEDVEYYKLLRRTYEDHHWIYHSKDGNKPENALSSQG